MLSTSEVKLSATNQKRKLHLRETVKRTKGTSVISVSKELAESWMAFNTINRRLDKGHVYEFKKRMDNGEWALNGQAIIFSKSGNLLDGQHRLAAVIMHGKPIEFDVRFGVDESTFETLDDGKRRSPGDIFHIHGVKNSTNIAAAIRMIIRMSIGSSSGDDTSSTRPSNHALYEWYLDHPEIAEFERLGYKYYDLSGRLLTSSVFTAYMYMMAQVDYDKAVEFMGKLALGTSLSEHDVIYKLRVRLVNSNTIKWKRMTANEKHAVILKAWNYFLTGKKVKHLKVNLTKEDIMSF